MTDIFSYGKPTSPRGTINSNQEYTKQELRIKCYKPISLTRSVIVTYAGFIFILLGLSIASVSALVDQRVSQTITQPVVEITTIKLKSSALGRLNEGQTQTYTNTTVPDFKDVISITTNTANVYLHLDSNLDSLTDYSTYNITVKFSQVAGSTYSAGDTACTLTLASPDSSIVLDTPGTWQFDFKVTTTADSVDSDTPTTVSIAVKAENISNEDYMRIRRYRQPKFKAARARTLLKVACI